MIAHRLLPALAAAALAAATLAAPPAPLAAQSLAQRVAAAPDGTLHFAFAVKPGICGNGENINVRGRSRDWEPDCDDGPGRVALDVTGHHITGLRFFVGGRWRAGVAATDLGQVPAAEASAYLFDLAAHADSRVAEHAIFPAAVADGVVAWPTLLDLARDADRPSAVRRGATFWLSQEAATAATKGLTELATSDGDRQVRHSAIFALSQRPRDEGVPALIQIARTSKDPDLRRQAIFWLGQSGDPRALDFLRAVLAGR